MQGPVDIKSDDRLQTEFDKITEEINKLEMVAFKAATDSPNSSPSRRRSMKPTQSLSRSIPT